MRVRAAVARSTHALAHTLPHTLGGAGRRLKLVVRRTDRRSMSGIPSVTASGLGLLDAAEQRLARSAQTFARSGATDDSSAEPSASAPDDVVDAAVGVIYGRSAFRIGVSLIAVGRDTEKSLLDILA